MRPKSVSSRVPTEAPESHPERTNGDLSVVHPPVAKPQPSVDAIRLRAYELWEAAGCPGGNGVPFWLEAEREMLSPS